MEKTLRQLQGYFRGGSVVWPVLGLGLLLLFDLLFVEGFFRDFDGRLRLSLHQPNRNSQERPVFLYLHDEDGQFTCTAEPKPE